MVITAISANKKALFSFSFIYFYKHTLVYFLVLFLSTSIIVTQWPVCKKSQKRCGFLLDPSYHKNMHSKCTNWDFFSEHFLGTVWSQVESHRESDMAGAFP